MLTQTELKAILDYNPDTGEFKKIAGKGSRPLGTVTESGYLRINVLGTLHYAHRLAFLHMTGKWPEGYADHINGTRLDNRWSNLRDVNPSQSLANQIVKGGTVGLKGVSSIIDRRYGITYMVAKARFNGIERSKSFNAKKLGIVEATYAAALAARDMREQMHGEFACHGSRS